MELIKAFSLLHSRVHAQDVYDRPSLAERVFGGLPDEVMRARPGKGLNSLVWLLWHMARTEDVAVNLVVAARSQVLDADWARRLRVTRTDIGTGMTEDEVAELTTTADVEAVRAYRSAVGRRTHEVVRALTPASWDEIQGPADVGRAAETGAFGETLRRAANVGQHPYLGISRGTQLFVTALDHNARHLGEAITVRGLAGFGLGM